MRYEAYNLTSLTTATAGAPLCAFRAPATETMRIREIGVTCVAATQTLIELRRATVVSVTPATTIAGQNHEPLGPASASLLVSSWTTVPTVNANGMRGVVLAASIGAGIIWTWPADDPLIVGAGNAIAEVCICNSVAVACSTLRYYAVWED